MKVNVLLWLGCQNSAINLLRRGLKWLGRAFVSPSGGLRQHLTHTEPSNSRRTMLPTTSIACTSLVVGGSPLPGGGTRSLRHRDRNTARQNSARRSEHLSSRSPRDAQPGDDVDQRPHRLSLGVDDRLRSSWRRMRSLSWASWRSACLDSRSCRFSTDWRVAPAAVLVADEMELMVMSVIWTPPVCQG